MDTDSHNRAGGRPPWWVRAIVGALVGAIAATLLSVVVAAVGLALGLATWNRLALGATGRMILAAYAGFIVLGIWTMLTSRHAHAEAGGRRQPRTANPPPGQNR